MVTFNLNSISRYRTEIMGFAMLGVICMHISIWCHLSGVSRAIMRDFSLFAYTDTFLIMSGMGIYFSVSKRFNTIKVNSFYSMWGGYFFRRISRVMLPYMILSFPLYCTITVLQHKPFLFVLENVSTLNLWYEGNPYGMWYIGLIMVLYIIYPLFHTLVYNPNIRFLSVTLLLGLILCIPLIVINFREYHNKVGVAIDVMPSFFIGSILGYYVKQSKKLNIILWIIATIAFWFLCKKMSGDYYLWPLAVMGVVAQKFAFLPMLVGIFCILHKINEKLLIPIQFLGHYSLEIYILHLLLYTIIQIIYPNTPVLSTTLAVITAFAVAPIAHNLIKRIFAI